MGKSRSRKPQTDRRPSGSKRGALMHIVGAGLLCQQRVLQISTIKYGYYLHIYFEYTPLDPSRPDRPPVFSIGFKGSRIGAPLAKFWPCSCVKRYVAGAFASARPRCATQRTRAGPCPNWNKSPWASRGGEWLLCPLWLRHCARGRGRCGKSFEAKSKRFFFGSC